MKTYGLIGFPLGHSFSARYFKEKFQREQIAAEYLNFEMESPEQLKGILQAYPQLAGFNVTIPHKQNIIPYLDSLSQEALRIGAVNCVKVETTANRKILTGYNTDAFGFQQSLLKFIPQDVRNALILGNGGAAKAIRYVLQALGMDVLTVSRTPRQPNEISYTEAEKYLPQYRLIVNATPLGTWPNIHTLPPLAYHLLSPRHYLFDLVYNPEVTAFMQQGLLQGAHVHNGYEMLIGQAEKAWEIWKK